MSEIKMKKTFDSVHIDHFSPAREDQWPKAINVHITFEEAMRLHLGLGQLLGKLNSYDRSTKRGRETAVNLCVYLQVKRITINEGKTKSPGERMDALAGRINGRMIERMSLRSTRNYAE